MGAALGDPPGTGDTAKSKSGRHRAGRFHRLAVDRYGRAAWPSPAGGVIFSIDPIGGISSSSAEAT